MDRCWGRAAPLWTGWRTPEDWAENSGPVALRASLRTTCGGDHMRAKQLRYRTIAVVALVLPLLAFRGVAEGKKPPPPVPWTGPVPKAHCGPNDRVESGLQGQTTLAERLSGDSERGYNCNLQLVGQFQGEGSWWQMAWFDHCAYYGTTGYTQDPGH